ncbi:hypothetical protein FPV67DRAFT_606515 [Lyophyllum atratum]|nr:hypothetical protein FPV67DRAFT_606515 [Lyophyllum atratum]
MSPLQNISSTSSTSPAPSPPPFTAISDSTSLPSLSSPAFQLPASASLDSHSRANGIDSDVLVSAHANQPSDVDPQILEALRSKDRIYVLKLGELMEGLINDRRPRIDLTPSTSYQRLLVHRCSAFYKLAPESDPASKGIIVLPTPDSRIPTRRLCDLVPAESTTQPAFKIMRRSQPDRRPNKAQSQAGSVAGEDADLSDVEPSESGSIGGRSNATGGSSKKRMTIEEREAAYNEARSRIFMDFEEKEKEKEKDMSASSSSLSLVSGSASTSAGGGSSVAGDLDDAASSPATESEYSAPSGPSGREKKDSRQLTRNASASSSSRSLHSSAASFNGGPGSSRNSRAPSPSFTYATIYEPTQGTVYDPTQPPPHHGYHPSQYLYPYSPPGQPPNTYFGAYPYYPPYNPYQSPPAHVHHSVSDPSTPSSSELYISPPHNGYSHPYGWPAPQHPMQSPPHMQHPSQLPPQPPHHTLNAASAPPPSVHNPSYQPYMQPPHAYTYPVYYPPQPGQPVEAPPPHLNRNMYEVPRSMNGNVMANPAHNNSAPTMGRNGVTTSPTTTNGRVPNRHSGVNGGKGRGGVPVNQGRAAWSYGPGVSQGGQVTSPGSVGVDAMGPRLSSSRRTSANSINSRSSNCDDVSSTASSSTTSSSSRRTYTSTSSQHPLPPRPDWAVGLKPQPTLHATQTRHHEHSHSNSRTMSPISPPRNLNGNSTLHTPASQQKPPVPLQSSTDFPPLSSVSAAPEKRTPVVSGAWGNTSSTRNIRMPSPGQGQLNSNAPVYYPNNPGATDSGETHSEDSDRGFERPPPKSSELFNPKVLRRPVAGKAQAEKDKERVRGDAVASAILVGQMEDMALDGQSVEGQMEKEPAALVCGGGIN